MARSAFANLSGSEKLKAPERLDAVEIGNYSIKLRWTPIHSNQLFGYLLERSTAFKDIWKSVHAPMPVLPVSSTEFEVGDVTPYGVYDFCIRSVIKSKRKLLLSDGCELDNVVAKQQYQPYPPRNIRVTGVSDGSVTMTWLEPLPLPDVSPTSYEYVIEMCLHDEDKILHEWKECCRTRRRECTVKVQHSGNCRFRVSVNNKDKDVRSLPQEMGDPEIRIRTNAETGLLEALVGMLQGSRGTTFKGQETGSIVFVISCHHMNGLRELWMSYNLGKVNDFFQGLFALQGTAASVVRDAELDIKVDQEDFHASRRHLLLTFPNERGFRMVILNDAHFTARTRLGLSEDYPVYCKSLSQKIVCADLEFLDLAMANKHTRRKAPLETRKMSPDAKETSSAAEAMERSNLRTKRSTSVDSYTAVLPPPKQSGVSYPTATGLVLAATNVNEDSSFTNWVTKKIVHMMRQKSHQAKLWETKHEVAMHQVESETGKRKSLQKEVTRLTQGSETAQKVLLDHKNEIEELRGVNKSKQDTIDELLAEKTKLTNKLAMKERQPAPTEHQFGEAMAVAKTELKGIEEPSKLKELERKVREEFSKLEKDEQMNVLVLGMPFAGKSSLINSMHAAVAHRWHKVVNLGDEYSGRPVTTDLVRYEMFRDKLTKPPIMDYNHNVFFWDTAGLEDLDEETFETLLGLIMEGRIPPDTNVHEYKDKNRPRPPTVSSLKKRFPRSGAVEEHKCNRVVFVWAADKDPPMNLLKAVTNAATKDRADSRILPVFLVISKCDKVDTTEKEDYESRREAAGRALRVFGNPQRCKEVSLYCNELTGPLDDFDYGSMRNDDGINAKMLNLWMALLSQAYRVKHAPPKKTGSKNPFKW